MNINKADRFSPHLVGIVSLVRKHAWICNGRNKAGLLGASEEKEGGGRQNQKGKPYALEKAQLLYYIFCLFYFLE